MGEEDHRLVREGGSEVDPRELHQIDCLHHRHLRLGVSGRLHPVGAAARDLVEIAADGPEGLRIVRCSGFGMDC